MYESLSRTGISFHLYIFAFDNTSENILKELNLANVTVISLKEFENNQLLAVKPKRSIAEYCWTCTPSTIYYCITHFNLTHCTYLDADLYFFSDPRVLIQEMGNNSVLITEHRYSKRYDQSKTSGIYCVQFIMFRNDTNGMKALTWWRDRCIEWCYDRFEDGKFGDQKYLDDWCSRFEGIHVLNHLGGGVAPWNVQQLTIQLTNKGFEVIENTTGKIYPLIFYHFHAVQFLKDNKVDLGAYRLPRSSINLYSTYVYSIVETNKMLLWLNFLPVEQRYRTKRKIPIFLHKLVRFFFGIYNIYNTGIIINYGKNSRSSNFH